MDFDAARSVEVPREESVQLLDRGAAEPAAGSSGAAVRRAVGRAAVLAGAAALAAAAYSKVDMQQKMMAMGHLRKPFRLYEGGLPMPNKSNEYDGISEPRPLDIQADDNGITNVFVLGDWGATLPWHTTYAATDWNDQKSQMNVANAMKNRAIWAKPQYILNVGDNFYVEGLEFSCNSPPSAIYGPGTSGMKGVDAFSSAWQQVYGPLANKPWLSVLGNHDYGGYRMDKGWPQQIGYSFVNYNWIMPTRYYMKRMHHPNYTVDVFMVDSNHHDAKMPGEEPNHNICSHHNYEGAGSCAANGGMPNVAACRSWFWASNDWQQKWLEDKLAKSDARWKIVNTHFPCGYDGDFYKRMKREHGLDLIVTGHRHQQELWWPGTTSQYVQALMKKNGWDGSAPACFVTGGGGGIVSQKFNYADYGRDLIWYGFFHLTMHRDWMNIELIGNDGVVAGNITIHPHGTPGALEEANFRWPGTGSPTCELFCGNEVNPFEKVCPKGSEPWDCCSECEGCKNIAGKGSSDEPSTCESYCGNDKAPFEKVCPGGSEPWKVCSECEGCKRIAGNGSLDGPSVLSDEQSTCKSFCGNDKAPFEKVCPGGSEPWKVCSECEGCKKTAGKGSPKTPSTCESYCGNDKAPFEKVCPGGSEPWKVCSECEGCKNIDSSDPGTLSTCESYCGSEKNPFQKVCPWGFEPWKVCSECEGCKDTKVEYK